MHTDLELQNDSAREALMYYTIAHDRDELPGNRRGAKLMYEHKYGSIDEPFGWNPRMTFGGFTSGVVQPIVGNTLKGWGWVIGWLIGFR